jgi:hypothetical protein
MSRTHYSTLLYSFDTLAETRRAVDFYTKDGTLGAYARNLILIPDYDVGFTVLDAGFSVNADVGVGLAIDVKGRPSPERLQVPTSQSTCVTAAAVYKSQTVLASLQSNNRKSRGKSGRIACPQPPLLWTTAAQQIRKAAKIGPLSVQNSRPLTKCRAWSGWAVRRIISDNREQVPLLIRLPLGQVLLYSRFRTATATTPPSAQAWRMF